VNPDSTANGHVIADYTLTNVDNSLQIQGLDGSNEPSEANYWANIRLSADGSSARPDLFGAEQLTFEIFADEPQIVSIAAIPQSASNGWANPTRAIQVTADDFELQDNGKYKAVLSYSVDDSPNFKTIATNAKDSIMTNIVLFVGTE